MILGIGFIHEDGHLGDGNSNIFSCSPRKIGEDEGNLTSYFLHGLKPPTVVVLYIEGIYCIFCGRWKYEGFVVPL